MKAANKYYSVERRSGRTKGEYEWWFRGSRESLAQARKFAASLKGKTRIIRVTEELVRKGETE